MLNDFINYLETQLKNGSIYVWGAQGQTATEAFIKKCESGKNETRALKLYKKRTAAGYAPKNIKAFDCSGLGMYWLQNLKYKSKNDMNANGMKGKCTIIQKNHIKKGDWAFRTYKTGSKKGRAYHIGYIIAKNGKLRVIHAKGRAYGVVEEDINFNYWNTFGRPSYFAQYIDTAEEKAEHASFNRELKKGCKGDDVYELQKLLNKAGDNIEVDGSFGSKTRIAVREYQKRKGLKVDGIAGKNTITALGGVWAVFEGFNRNMRKGDTGADVTMLQTLLDGAGYNIEIDGSFGTETEEAVRAYQKEKKLENDGIAGKNTITALGGKWNG